jgi:cell division protein FtsB
MKHTDGEIPDAIGSNDTLIHQRRRKHESRPRIPGEPSVTMLRPAKSAVEPDDEPGDYTKIILRRRNRRMFGVGATVIGAAIVVTLFLLPLRSWRSQQQLIKQREAETAALERVNAELDAENRYLHTPGGLADAANNDLGLAPPGALIRPVDAIPLADEQLPAGWPYSLVTGIIGARYDEAVRAAQAAAEAKAAADAAAAAAAAGTTIAP